MTSTERPISILLVHACIGKSWVYNSNESKWHEIEVNENLLCLFCRSLTAVAETHLMHFRRLFSSPFHFFYLWSSQLTGWRRCVYPLEIKLQSSNYYHSSAQNVKMREIITCSSIRSCCRISDVQMLLHLYIPQRFWSLISGPGREISVMIFRECHKR